MADFRWTPETTEAAQLIADGKLTYPEIAAKVGVVRETIYNWRQKPEFMARDNEHIEEFREQVRRRGLADRDRRIDALNDRWDRMKSVIEARAAAYADGGHGGETGLICRKVKGWEGPEDEKTPVYEYEVDTGLLKELREHEKQAAQELGQWTEKQEISGDDAKPVVVKVLRGIKFDEL